MLTNALAATSGLLSFAAIVCWAPGLRVWWAIFPMLVVCVAVMHETNQRARTAGPRRLTREEPE